MNSTFKILCIALLTATSGPAFAQDMSSWSDKTLCRLVLNTTKNETYRSEVASRGIVCASEVSIGNQGNIKDVKAYKAPWRMRDAHTEQEQIPLYLTAKGNTWNGKETCFIHYEMDDNKRPLDFGEKEASCYLGRYFSAYPQEFLDLDFDGDGIRDKIVIGVTNTLNNRATSENYLEITDMELTLNGNCTGGVGSCVEVKRKPLFWKGREDGTFFLAQDLLIDPRKLPGIGYGHQIVPADFNGDGTLDFYISEHGRDQHHVDYKGDTGNYYLSQSNGTWLESSETHMLHRGKVWTAFNHGVTAGDIDNDGDIDIVETMIEFTKSNGLWCRINDGSGKMTMKPCGQTQDGLGVQLGDLDNDGCLDAVQTGGKGHFNGVEWGNCKGWFTKGPKINQHRSSVKDDPQSYGNVLESWLWDLDNDGDLDIVAGHVGSDFYVGAAISIHENLGNRKFKEATFIEFNKRPTSIARVKRCHRGTEGNPCSAYLQEVHFIDVDQDGFYEIVFEAHAPHNNRTIIGNKFEWQITGMIVRNKGNMEFSWDRKDNYAANYSKWAKHRLDEQSDETNAKLSKQFLISEPQVKDTEYSRKFDSNIKKNGEIVFEGVDKFTKFEIGIPLEDSGALLLGFKDLNVVDDNSLNVRAHIKYGNIDFSVNVCFVYYSQHEFLAARTSFNRNDWGGLDASMSSNGCIGVWELKSEKPKLQEIGAYTVLKDIQENSQLLLEAIDKQTDDSACFLLKKMVTNKKCADASTQIQK